MQHISTITTELRAARSVRRQQRFVAFFFTAAVSYVAALATFFAVLGHIISI